MNEGTMDDPRNGGTHEGGARRGEFRLQRNSLHQQVVERLRDMIVEGELAPGRRIPEAELCESFGISRTPLREALRVLDSEGLVEPDGTRGSRVTKITTREIAELFEVVSGIERMAAELAAERMTDADVENLRAITLRMEQHFQRGDRQKYFRLNQVIHHTIVKLAGNGILASTHAGLMNKVRRGALFRHPVPGSLARIGRRAQRDRARLRRARRRTRRTAAAHPCPQDGDHRRDHVRTGPRAAGAIRRSIPTSRRGHTKSAGSSTVHISSPPRRRGTIQHLSENAVRRRGRPPTRA